MKKGLKVVGIGCGGLVGLLVVGGAIFWFGWLSAPEPTAVCSHVQGIQQKEVGQELPPGAFDMDGCVSGMKRAKQFDGLIAYAEEANCIMDAESVAAMESCEGN